MSPLLNVFVLLCVGVWLISTSNAQCSYSNCQACTKASCSWDTEEELCTYSSGDINNNDNCPPSPFQLIWWSILGAAGLCIIICFCLYTGLCKKLCIICSDISCCCICNSQIDGNYNPPSRIYHKFMQNQYDHYRQTHSTIICDQFGKIAAILMFVALFKIILGLILDIIILFIFGCVVVSIPTAFYIFRIMSYRNEFICIDIENKCVIIIRETMVRCCYHNVIKLGTFDEFIEAKTSRHRHKPKGKIERIWWNVHITFKNSSYLLCTDIQTNDAADNLVKWCTDNINAQQLNPKTTTRNYVIKIDT